MTLDLERGDNYDFDNNGAKTGYAEQSIPGARR